VEYQQIAAVWFSSAPSTDPFLVKVVLDRCGRGLCGLVFGTLLGPEATGPGGFSSGFVCFWFPGCIDHAWWPFGGCVWGVWFGVVV
jgi:hypothetical protein